MKIKWQRTVAAIISMTVLLSAALTGCGKTTVTEDVSTVVISGSEQGGDTAENAGENKSNSNTSKHDGKSSSSSTDKTDVKNYTFTIMSPWLMRSEKDAVTEYEKSFWAKIKKIQKNAAARKGRQHPLITWSRSQHLLPYSQTGRRFSPPEP